MLRSRTFDFEITIQRTRDSSSLLYFGCARFHVPFMPMPAVSQTEAVSGRDNGRTDHRRFNTFKDVTQISSGQREASASTTVDMAKAFKAMAASKSSSLSAQAKGPIQAFSTSGNNFAPLLIQGEKLPLDLTLKTNIRFTSSFSLQKYHCMSNKDLFSGLQEFIYSLGHSTLPLRVPGNAQSVSFMRALHSWVHPQSVLPSSVMSGLASSAAHGSSAEKDFLHERQQTWMESFRSLYYMYRNNQCDIFYLSSQQILAMFLGGCFNGGDTKMCRAYITRSTRGFRGLLQEQDIKFSMPLCPRGLDAMTNEEVLELTEFERMHPGQTRLVDSMISVDNSPQSILAFTGHKSVHGLYDFLLNHRSFLSSTTGTDVPVLYSPVAFPNAALVTPEVVYRELRHPADVASKEHNEDNDIQANGLPLMTKGFSLELKGNTLPPWVIWRVFAVLRESQPEEFVANLSTDPHSSGLNVAQEICVAMDPQLEPTQSILGKEISNLVMFTNLQTGFLKEVKLLQGSYSATVSMV